MRKKINLFSKKNFEQYLKVKKWWAKATSEVLPFDQSSVFYVGQIFEENHDNQNTEGDEAEKKRRSIYSKEFFEWFLKTLSWVSQKGQKIHIKDCSEVSRILNDLPDWLTQERQSKRMNHYILNNVPEREEDIKIENLSESHPELLSFLTEFKESCSIKETELKKSTDISSSKDIFSHLAYLFAYNLQFQKMIIYRAMTKRQKEALEWKDPAVLPSSYYALVEAAIRLYDFLEWWVEFHGWASVQYRFDGIINKMLKWSVKKGSPELHKYIQQKMVRKEVLGSFHFDHDAFNLTKERAKRRSQLAVLAAWVSLVLFWALAYRSWDSMIKKNKKDEAIAEVLMTKIWDKSIEKRKYTDSDTTDMQRTKRARKLASNIYDRIVLRYGEGENKLDEDAIAMVVYRLIEEWKRRAFDINRIDTYHKHLDDFIDVHMLDEMGVYFMEKDVPTMPNKAIRDVQTWRWNMYAAVKNTLEKRLERDDVELIIFGEHQHSIVWWGFNDGKNIGSLSSGTKIKFEYDTEVLIGSLDGDVFSDKVWQDVAMELLMTPENKKTRIKVKGRLYTIFQAYFDEAMNDCFVNELLTDKEKFWDWWYELTDEDIDEMTFNIAIRYNDLHKEDLLAPFRNLYKYKYALQNFSSLNADDGEILDVEEFSALVDKHTWLVDHDWQWPLNLFSFTYDAKQYAYLHIRTVTSDLSSYDVVKWQKHTQYLLELRDKFCM